jgi:hypothetical protein
MSRAEDKSKRYPSPDGNEELKQNLKEQNPNQRLPS